MESVGIMDNFPLLPQPFHSPFHGKKADGFYKTFTYPRFPASYYCYF